MKALIFILLVLVQACAAPDQGTRSPSNCLQAARAVIDMGSGSTKLNMAQVESCGGAVRIIKKVDQDHARAVPLEAAKDSSGRIGLDARASAISALEDLREVAKTWAKAQNFSELGLTVVGTHALRTATNKDEFINQIETAGFLVRALTQDEEALAGVDAVLKSPRPEACATDELLVWDVGGGSTQITRASAAGPQIMKFEMGAESFRQNMIGFNQMPPDLSCPRPAGSPNPLGVKNLKKARRMVAKQAGLRADSIDIKNTCVIGIGGVHNKAVAAQLEKNWNKVGPCSCGQQPNCLPTNGGYNKKEVQCLAELFAQKNDCSPEMKGPYSLTAASNLVMILGFMDQFGIERVHVKNINMGDHYLSDNKVLKFKIIPTK